MDSSKSPEDSTLDSLSTSIEKLQRKAKAIGELDSKISGELQDPEELGRDVYESIELQDGITDTIDQIKQFISHHMKSVEPCPPNRAVSQSLSAIAQPFMPRNVVTPSPQDEQGILPSSSSNGSVTIQPSQSVS